MTGLFFFPHGVGETARTASLFARFLYRTIVSSVYNDKATSEVALATANLKWSGIYPVILTNGPLSQAVDVRPMSSVQKVSGLPKVSRADVARAMLDAAENEKTTGQRLLVTASGTVR
ncbi:NAD(P)H-binding protein (plasmid) [Rhizobium sp. CB3171]|uniref:NAD(P)H-binding protein n=1 Tax=Rhizobium sp. CB3171 TaxID=3039157 RepID=UPI0024B2790B|nr:NAD(P)H-binding protein [Rhizobium sp. CB3171]WFU05776.1 NAD(P)H-binding protein [Rhizobium sp. CB3171]